MFIQEFLGRLFNMVSRISVRVSAWVLSDFIGVKVFQAVQAVHQAVQDFMVCLFMTYQVAFFCPIKGIIIIPFNQGKVNQLF